MVTHRIPQGGDAMVAGALAEEMEKDLTGTTTIGRGEMVITDVVLHKIEGS